MSDQEEKEFRSGEPSAAPQSEARNRDYRFKTSYRTEEYTDAHYESADDSTVPPRYYTPPEKPQREEKARAGCSILEEQLEKIFFVVHTITRFIL